jgi:hypothetical protein
MIALLATPGLAQDEEKELGWSDTAEFSLVATSGNSEATSLGFKNTTYRSWEKALFELKLAGLRVETTTRTGAAIQRPDGSFEPLEVTAVTAESYYAGANYNRTISKNFFWYAGLVWERNTFAGFDSRTIVEGGVGNLWSETKKQRWFTRYAATYTDQRDVVPRPDFDGKFAGLRAQSDYWRKFGENGNTKYVNQTVIDFNLDQTEDWRVDMLNSVSVKMTEMLAMQAGLRWLYDNDPAVAALGLVDGNGDPITGPGGDQIIVDVPLDELDTIFTVSLVVEF